MMVEGLFTKIRKWGEVLPHQLMWLVCIDKSFVGGV